MQVLFAKKKIGTKQGRSLHARNPAACQLPVQVSVNNNTTARPVSNDFGLC